MSTTESLPSIRNLWPHRLAWALACGTFPLIWMGGLVTSYRAGMSVPDWPTTYGHWFYPLQAWFWACFDLFLEHTHRVLAQCVGLTAIVLSVLLWRVGGRKGDSPVFAQAKTGTVPRKGMRWLAAGVLGGVLLQGTLGGLRVLLDATEPAPWTWLATWVEWLRQYVDGTLLAKIHGCTAPLYFALCTVAVVVTSRRWINCESVGTAVPDVGAAVALPPPTHQASPGRKPGDGVGSQCEPSPGLRPGLTLALTLLLYLDIVLGVQLRHYVPDADPAWFQLWVWLKLIVAGTILVGLIWLLVGQVGNLPPFRQVGNLPHTPDRVLLLRRAKLLLGLFLLQVALGAATWVTNYGWPAWFTDYFWGLQYTVVAKGKLQVQLTTLHVAVGSLTTATALNWALWSHRLLRGPRFR
jgi:heme a synthase